MGQSAATQDPRRRFGAADLERALRALPHGVIVHEPGGRIVLANDAAARILGLRSGEDVVRLGRDELLRRFEVIGSPPEPGSEPTLMRWRLAGSDEERWSRVTARTIEGSDGQIWTVTSFDDVTTERRALESLREGESRFETVLRNIADAVVALDGADRVTFANRVAEELSGWTAADLRGRPIGERIRLIADSDRAPLAPDVLLRTSRPGAPVRAWLVPREGPEIPVDVIASEGEDGLVRAVLAIRDARDARRADRRARLLAEAGALLASSLDYESTLRAVARLLVPHVADWCEIDLLEPDGTLKAVEIAHADPEKVRWARELRAKRPPRRDLPSGPYHVVRTGVPELFSEIPDAALVAAAADEEELAMLRAIGFSSTMCVPLVARGETIGVLTLVATESRAHFGPADLAFARDLAGRAASAIDNARQHQEALRALGALQRLETITSVALAGASVDDALHDVLASLCTALGADLGVILLLAAAEDALELRATHGFRPPPTSPGAIPRDEPVWSWEVLDADSPRLAQRIEDVAAFRGVAEARGVARVLSCPLRGAHGPFGVMHLASHRPDAFSSQEILLAQLAGERIAAVVARLALLESERRAREEAERANRLKDDFLAIVSHELRTPLNAVVGWIQILQKRQDEKELLERGLDRIARNGEALVRIVGDLIDVAQIMRGRLTMRRERVAIAEVLQATAEMLAPVAATRQVELRLDVSARVGEVLGDPQRLQQVAWNLISNAVKFTPAGGHVSARARRRAGWVILEVEDDGRGIAPEFLPFVFERFRQEDQGRTREHGGLGLGLAIVRHIVEQHGGDVSARSEGVGRGATFVVRLPAARAARSTDPP